MNEQEQRIAIAEVCGYVWNIGLPTKSGWWTDPHGFQVSWGNNKSDALNQIEGTNYLNDLNAMREAKSTLTAKQQYRFTVILREVLHKAGIDTSTFFLINASAEHQAEAFLKTLNLWIE